jgi:hypothetical protein
MDLSKYGKHARKEVPSYRPHRNVCVRGRRLTVRLPIRRVDSLWIYDKSRGAVVLIMMLLSSYRVFFNACFAATLIDVRKSVRRKTWEIDVIDVDG